MMNTQILCIDTSSETGFAALGVNGKCAEVIFSTKQTEHASFLQPAIGQLLAQSGTSFEKIDAIAVSNGPGSYTGLRVSLAAAKAICYAAKKPLILLSTLEIMAYAMREQIDANDANVMLAPMIDARRQEVYTAVYNGLLETMVEPVGLILSPNAYEQWLQLSIVYFCGSGAQKWQLLCNHINARFIGQGALEQACCTLAQKYFAQETFAHLAYSEPYYIKPFYGKSKFQE